MSIRPLCLALIRGLLGLSLLAVSATQAGAQTATAAGETEIDVKLSDLGINYPLRLKTVFGQASVPLNLRSDQLAVAATLDLRVAHSPSLRSDLSHLTVLVNGEVVWTRPLVTETAAGAVYSIPINPLLLLSKNEIRFELVAHYAKEGECEDPAHTTLWADISNASSIKVRLRKVDVPPTLDKMPAPWFEAASQKRLLLPFVFASTPTSGAVRAAGIVAAWFGAQADYRGADFPVSFGAAPQGNAVMFQTGSATAEIRALRNPADDSGMVLLFSAPDEAGLIEVAQAFALGSIVMRGDAARVGGVTLPEPQTAWQSPRWPTEHLPLALKDHLLGPASVSGLNPGPVTYEFSLPPDLYFLGKSAGEITVGYRAARASSAKSSLNVSLNNQYLGSALLNPKAGVVDDSLTRQLKLEVPPDSLRAKNRLIAQYQFIRDTSKACEDFRSESLQGAIDPRSIVELAPYAHFAEMPALQKLVTGAFPYSKFADLSKTAIVLPDTPSPSDISAALIALGHIGHWAKDAAVHLQVVPVSEIETVADRDLFVVAPPAALGLPPSFDAASVIGVGSDGIELKQASSMDVLQARIEGRQVRDAERYAGRVLVQTTSALGAMVEFESPLQRGNTAVVVHTTASADPRDVVLKLVDPGASQFVEGGLVLVTPKQVSGYQLGDTYTVGSLPWWYAAVRWMRLHPYLIVPLAVLLALIGARFAVALLRRRAATRVPAPK